ncbi:hypothetical protein EJB05_26543, partial [Eragrostis curvula]
MMASSSSVNRGTTAQSMSTIVADAVEGSHILKIEGYSRTKGLSNGKRIKSGTFEVGGHTWCIEYYPDGNEPENAGWISFFLCLQNSSSRKVQANIKFCLLDEVGDPVPEYRKIPNNICPFHIEDRWGYGRFIERDDLEESSYLMDDCFRVRFDIMVSKEFRTEETKKFVTVPPPDMHQHIGCLLASQVDADVMFQVGTETFTAHRLVLAARSKVLKAELFGPMKEKNMRYIRIDDMEARVFKAMLHFIYMDSLPNVDKDEALVMAQHLLVAADRYDLERLKLICEDKLCNYINTSTVANSLALAEQHGCRGLKAACFEFLKLPGNLNTIMSSDGFQHLTSSCPTFLEELVVKLAP